MPDEVPQPPIGQRGNHAGGKAPSQVHLVPPVGFGNPVTIPISCQTSPLTLVREAFGAAYPGGGEGERLTPGPRRLPSQRFQVLFGRPVEGPDTDP